MKIFIILLILISTPVWSEDVRIKDIADFDGVRGNDLVGYGLVAGLNGTGDGLRNSPFTEDIMSNLLERLGVNVTGEKFKPRNVAAVMVTATLPPFGRAGSRIDVTISAIGDAKSLLGGTLIMTPLNGADGQIYAVAQGPVLAGGNVVEGEAAKVVMGVPTAGVIPSGARIEREVDFALSDLIATRLALRVPDFTTASRIEKAVNDEIGAGAAEMIDSGTVLIKLTDWDMKSPAHVMSKIENVVVEPQQRARVVVDHRSGTVVLGSDVKIGRVAVAQGGMTLKVEEAPLASQPNPFSFGESLLVPKTRVEITNNNNGSLAEVSNGTNLSSVVEGLNSLGVGARDLIDILKAIHAAGALHAEFIVQ